MKKVYSQQGFLLISAALIVTVLLGVVSSFAAYFALSGTHLMRMQLRSVKAYYIADSGVQKGIYKLLTGSLQCSGINGDSSLTNVSFGGGEYTVTSTSYAPTAPTLLAQLNNGTTTVIRPSSVTGFAPLGRIRIDDEIIHYSKIGIGSGECGGGYSVCFLSLIRGMDGTADVTHSLGALVHQNQCDLSSQGGYTDLSSPLAQNQAGEGAFFGEGSGWFAGVQYAGELIYGWNGVTWVRNGPYGGILNYTMNGVKIVSLDDAWIIGDTGGTETILHWNGVVWSAWPDSSIANASLNGIDCLFSSFCMVVGDNRTFGRWNGSSWTSVSFSTLNFPSGTNVNSVSCTATNNCYAVAAAALYNFGGFTGNRTVPTILKWNGFSWSRVFLDYSAFRSYPYNLNAIDCTSSTLCWAAGNNGLLMRLSGTTWSRVAPPVSLSTVFRGIKAVASNDIWAVGYLSSAPIIIHYNGSLWSIPGTIDPLVNFRLYAVDCRDANDCWLAGASGGVAHWDGSTLYKVTSNPAILSANIYGISLYDDSIFGKKVGIWDN